ncbi:hypothetical protein NA56DRAFT_698623 [Hyaloscypha hepaticicola]|uniref:Fumarylacetoacetase-like C-terminal domain-containing protein n=1 Tax=Hyaloscypha hepaticicola TaxID=2082293 RepID=A0A2J6QJL7_9HELO|nr:hypothetical protein NA56DRAFT_698623 [Hyaloscypha hepaticicola]
MKYTLGTWRHLTRYRPRQLEQHRNSVIVYICTILSNAITKQILTVKQLFAPSTKEDCIHSVLRIERLDHAKEANLPLPKAPIFFGKRRDYEAELAFVVGKTGRDISEGALDHVLGYTASNDVHARDMQISTAQCSFYRGPVLISSSVIKDPQTLLIKATYNDATVQDGHKKDIIFNISQQISYLSQATTLQASSIFLSGKPAVIGDFGSPRVVLQDGGEW